MTSSINKLLIALLILLSIIWANFDFFYFAHFHLDENGQTIVHAHPYQKENQRGHNAPTHTHSKTEFTLLSLIYQVLSFFTSYLFLFIFLLHFLPNLKTKFSFQLNLNELFFKTIFRCGPPSLVQFS